MNRSGPHRKYDDWYYSFQDLSKVPAELGDRSVACWTNDGRKFSRGELLRLLKSDAGKWNRWRRSLPDIRWYNVKGDLFWIPGDLLPNLPSFIRRVCSSFAPAWGVLRTRLV